MNTTVLHDLLITAEERALDAVARTAVLAPRSHRAAILLHVAYRLTRAAATSYALDRPVERGADASSLANAEAADVLRCFHAICAAWALAPDREAMDRAMQAALDADPVNPFTAPAGTGVAEGAT
jgi:hypothetical protein